MTITTPPESGFTPDSTVGAALRHPVARALLETYLPELRTSANQLILAGRPLGLVIATSPGLENENDVSALWDELNRLAPPVGVQIEAEVLVTPSSGYEHDTIDRGSAAAVYPSHVAQFARFELLLDGPSHGNPFVDVELRAIVETPSGSTEVPGFYDGNGAYRLRFLPEEVGGHSFTTRSNARSLDGLQGGFMVRPAAESSHGPVRVDRQYHFAHADGTRHIPVGTTAYAWTHQGDDLEEKTLATLRESAFNKVRMCIFPKSYLYNTNEPSFHPFAADLGGFDFQRFDIEYWRHLELRIEQLERLNIQADLILFHPYDRWGFSTMDPVADDRYVRYAVARLASFSNVWWSLANEYDLLPSKSTGDWERFAGIVTKEDPTRHLLSIHNCFDFYDYGRPWITHASIQRQDIYKTAELTTEWRERWGKPVVIDECAYEGDIDQGWGNITGQEMVRRFWEGAIRGGYVGHGETYFRDDEVLWWSKGGELHGTSPARIAFLREILEDAPRALEPLAMDWDIPSAGVEGEYYLFYYGFTQPRFRRFLLDPSVEYEVDVIDTWAMTVERQHELRSGRFEVQLPGRPYMALRLRAVH